MHKNCYADLSPWSLVYLNSFGEPFFNQNGVVFKINPETGEAEEVCSYSDFQINNLDDYWTGDSLRLEWELEHGKQKECHFLAPITPFVLGGEFEVKNLMSIPIEELVEYYKKIRNSIQNLQDGTDVQMVAKP